MLERMGRPLRGFGNGTANVVGAVFPGYEWVERDAFSLFLLRSVYDRFHPRA